METHTLRQTSVLLPGLDEEDLTEVASLDGDKLTEFSYTGARLRELSLSGVTLMSGRISELVTQRTNLNKLAVSSVELTGCDLSHLHWSDSKLSRVVFRDCRLLGALLEEVTFDNVIFERCRLDYSVFVNVRAAGPVIFNSCSLREMSFTRADMTGSAAVDCDLLRTEFNGGTYRGLDLRGNDLAGLRGLSSLRKVTIDRSQLPDLARAAAADLEITIAEDQT
ncbi:pentapeptide repeat-containing protein [Microbispora sp. NPDC088329]|uniref:pentapeptide repeat-containing protein n=1 Tax=Microbispora sp. NPDC088329 TaxID=3154869 RepID=UPI00341CEE12